MSFNSSLTPGPHPLTALWEVKRRISFPCSSVFFSTVSLPSRSKLYYSPRSPSLRKFLKTFLNPPHRNCGIVYVLDILHTNIIQKWYLGPVCRKSVEFRNFLPCDTLLSPFPHTHLPFPSNKVLKLLLKSDFLFELNHRDRNTCIQVSNFVLLELCY